MGCSTPASKLNCFMHFAFPELKTGECSPQPGRWFPLVGGNTRNTVQSVRATFMAQLKTQTCRRLGLQCNHQQQLSQLIAAGERQCFLTGQQLTLVLVWSFIGKEQTQGQSAVRTLRRVQLSSGIKKSQDEVKKCVCLCEQ